MLSSTYNYFAGIIGQSLGVCIAIGIALYILLALGMTQIAANRGIKYPWLAWIPVAGAYLLGKTADLYSRQILHTQAHSAITLPALTLAIIILLFFPPVGAVIALVIATVLLILVFIAFYKVYDWCTPFASLLLILSVIFIPILPVIIFLLRNKVNPQYMARGRAAKRKRPLTR